MTQRYIIPLLFTAGAVTVLLFRINNLHPVLLYAFLFSFAMFWGGVYIGEKIGKENSEEENEKDDMDIDIWDLSSLK